MSQHAEHLADLYDRTLAATGSRASAVLAVLDAFEAMQQRIGDLFAEERARQEPDLFSVLAAVHARTGVAADAVLSTRRDAHIASARRIAFVALRSLGWSLPRIGRAMRRDHTTVLVGVRDASEPERRAAAAIVGSREERAA